VRTGIAQQKGMNDYSRREGWFGDVVRRVALALTVAGLGVCMAVPAVAQPPWAGIHRRDREHRYDHEVFLYLLDHRKQIDRTVTALPEGVETLTESDDEEVAAKIREHALAMRRRVEEGRPIHMRDPLFAEVFRHADQIDMTVEPTVSGVLVRETSQDAYVAALIRKHAWVVDRFVAVGHEEVHRDHALPPRK
jgi:hypothetical protein